MTYESWKNTSKTCMKKTNWLSGAFIKLKAQKLLVIFSINVIIKIATKTYYFPSCTFAANIFASVHQFFINKRNVAP